MNGDSAFQERIHPDFALNRDVLKDISLNGLQNWAEAVPFREADQLEVYPFQIDIEGGGVRGQGLKGGAKADIWVLSLCIAVAPEAGRATPPNRMT